MTSDKTIIFQHIPKTAGSTLHSIFNKTYKKKHIYNIFAGTSKDPEYQEFINLDAAKKNQIQLLKGHMPHGLHNYLEKEYSYMTMLRDPVKRAISQFHYIKTRPVNRMHDIVTKNNWTLGEFIESGVAKGFNNGQTRWLLGDYDLYEFNEIGDSHLAQVLETIEEHYSFVGINEVFDESILIMGKILGWKSTPFYRVQNKNKASKSKNISEKDIEIIKKYNAQDIALYHAMKEQFETLAKGIQDFEQLLSQYRQKNRLYQKLTYPLTILNI